MEKQKQSKADIFRRTVNINSDSLRLCGVSPTQSSVVHAMRPNNIEISNHSKTFDLHDDATCN